MTETTQNQCYHCGEECRLNPVKFDDKIFCCNGCKTVYEILSNSNACKYYSFQEHPGTKNLVSEIGNKYAFLDNEEIRKSLLDFSDGGIGKIKFFIPVIHCSSCIWLLENLQKFNKAIIQSTVNFTKKEVSILFKEDEVTVRQLVELLVSLNYKPIISQNKKDDKKARRSNNKLLFRLGVAGFCFGNIMLFSFPGYLSIDDTIENLLRQNFGILNILFGIPVAFYSGSDYLLSAFQGIRKKFINIDIPIALGIFVLFFRSLYEIVTATGPGFMDSLSGLVFFLLIGKWYQNKTYQALSFERDYRSYFPLGVTVINDERDEKIIPLKNLKTGMRILVRNQEIIPADSLLVKGDAQIDYSFVSGESTPIPKKEGDRVFAGGRQTGTAIELIIENEVEQSRLTELWNQEISDKKEQTQLSKTISVVSRYLTIIILIIAFSGGIVWWFIDSTIAINVITSVLIVACPCALALTVPFTFGGTIRIFGRNGFYLKQNWIVEKLAETDTVVFDKTGTLTQNDTWNVDLNELNIIDTEFALIHSLVRQSTHPLSVSIYQSIKNSDYFPVSEYNEIAGKGIEGKVDGKTIKVGSRKFVLKDYTQYEEDTTKVFVSINEKQVGYIQVKNLYRKGFSKVIEGLKKTHELHLLSGDNDAELPNLLPFFDDKKKIRFHQSPIDKLNYIRTLQKTGKKVLMIGDGLNDAGALHESHCGISIADDVYHFSPACDAILSANQFSRIHEFIRFCKSSMTIVKISLLISFLYNVSGLYFALSGNLTPVLSAVLMPLSSVTVVVFVTVCVLAIAKRNQFHKKQE